MNETEHLLTIIAEESAEVGQVACKAIRFGLSDVGPNLTENNRRRLERELADLMATADVLGLCIRDEDKATKIERLKKYMAYAREVGTLEAKPSDKTGDFCCAMRAKFLLGIIADRADMPTPMEAVDFINFDIKREDGKPVIMIKFCPFCGGRIAGPLRTFEEPGEQPT